ncbi:MAG: DUF2807 domain-containing protein [Alphaproteobacteria bacterium]
MPGFAKGLAVVTLLASWAFGMAAAAQPHGQAAHATGASASHVTGAPAAPPAPPLPPAPPSPPWYRAPSTELRLKDVAAIVHIIPENRADISFSIANEGPLPTPEVHPTRTQLTIDGGLRRRIGVCNRDRDGFSVSVDGFGRVAEARLPVIVVRIPQAAVIDASGAVQMHVEPAQTLRLEIGGCGAAEVERVVGAADVSTAGGDMEVRLFDVGSIALREAGGGNVFLGAVRAGMDLSVAGAGDIVVTRADGPTNIAIQGSGDVVINGGHASTLSVAIVGSGDVVHLGEADRLDAATFGSGDVRVRQVNGPVTKRIFGGGDVTVGQ